MTTNKQRALALVDAHIMAADAAGLIKTSQSWREYRLAVEAKDENEIIISSKRFGS